MRLQWETQREEATRGGKQKSGSSAGGAEKQDAMDMDGAEAHRLGVADVVVDDGLALAFAKDLAKRLSELPSGAVSSTKRFFEQEAAKSAEYEDAEAARLFAMDCEGDSAKATLAKFTVPA